MSLIKKHEMTEKKLPAIRRIKRYERQMEAFEKPDPFHYVSETNGVSSLAPECQEPLSHSNENS